MSTVMIVLSVIFFVISTFFSMVGMGGGILYVPILLFAGFSIKHAPAISLILILSTGISALLNFSKHNKVDWKLALVIEPATNIMAIVGGYFSNALPARVLLSLLIAILIIAAILMIKKPNLKKQKERAEHVPWYCWHRFFGETDYVVNIPLVVSAAGLIGILAGMLGITGGVIKLPIMVLLCGVPMDIAVATSTVMVTITATAGLIGHGLHETIAWQTGLLLAITAVIGGRLGSKLSMKTDKSKLKTGFGYLLFIVAAKILWQVIHMHA